GRRQPLRDRGRVAPEAGRGHARHGRAAGARAAGGAARMTPAPPALDELPVLEAAPARRSAVFVPDEVLLYDLSDSPFCLKERICLQLKGVPFRLLTMTFGARRALGGLTPLGGWPVLLHGDAVIADKRRTAPHPEAVHPEPRL